VHITGEHVGLSCLKTVSVVLCPSLAVCQLQQRNVPASHFGVMSERLPYFLRKLLRSPLYRAARHFGEFSFKASQRLLEDRPTFEPLLVSACEQCLRHLRISKPFDRCRVTMPTSLVAVGKRNSCIDAEAHGKTVFLKLRYIRFEIGTRGVLA
jgi:hypothetical protein